MTFLRIFWAWLRRRFNMGLADNLDKVAYNTVYPTDKIVFTESGSFLHTTDTQTRTYDNFGFPFDVERYRIRHGFDRPVFVECLWSRNSGTQYQPAGGNSDGSSNYVIAYSDSTYVYIECSGGITSGQRVYYQLICSWIQEYDTTNPSVEPFTNLPTTYTQVFNSRSVIPSIVKEGVLQLSTTSGTFTNVLGTIAHNLGYTPSPKVYFEAFDGEVWPMNYGGNQNPYLIDTDQAECNCFVDDTTLTINAIIKSGNGVRNFWYKLYAPIGDPQIGGYTADQNAV